MVVGGQRAYVKLFNSLTSEGREQRDVIVRPAFRSIDELKSFLHVDYEYSFNVLTEPQNWNRQLMRQSFILGLTAGNKLELFIHGIDDPSFEAGKVFEEEKAVEKLRELGIISETGRIVVSKGGATSVVPLRLGINGHSHPFGHVVRPSAGDDRRVSV